MPGYLTTPGRPNYQPIKGAYTTHVYRELDSQDNASGKVNGSPLANEPSRFILFRKRVLT